MVSSERWKQISEVLNEVLDLPLDRRGAYLDERCPDRAFRHEVEELMEAHDEAGDFLENDGKDNATEIVSPEERKEDPLVGEKVDDYRIESVLGKGGMGTVFRAVDVNLSREVALKRVNPGMAEDASLMRRFRSEARALARIDSPHIVRIYALRSTDEGLFIVMEFVEGGTLADPMNEGAMGEDQAVGFFRKMLMALRDAHRAEVIHRDIKPENVMLARDGRVKVTDFGLARLQQREKQVTVTQTIAGTLNYMSPEQVKDPGNLDHRSDLFSLGMTFYEMLAGRLPYEEDSNDFDRMQAIVTADFPEPSAYRTDLAPALNDLVVKALQKDPDDRFQSAEAMLEALDAYEEEAADAGVVEQPEADEEATAAETEESSSLIDSWVGRIGLAILMFAILNTGRYVWVNYGEGDANAGEEGSTAAVAPAMLSVVTSPQKASVYLDGRYIGRTPLIDQDVAGESVNVRLEKSGFAARDTTLHATPGQSIALDLGLSRLDEPSGRVSAREPSLDDQDESVAAPGARAKTASRDEPSSAPPSPAPEKAQTPARATLDLGIEPSGTITVGGKKQRGSGTLSVPAGRQAVHFESAQYGAKDTTLSVQAGGTKKLTCYFRQAINVNTRGPWASIWVNGENVDQGGTTLKRGPGTYRIEARRTGYVVSGGAHRVKVGGETRSTRSFTGNARTITVAPTFQPKEHLLVFEVQNNTP